MRSIQEIFNTVIAAGYYGERGGKMCSPFMCIALRLASMDLTLSEDEYSFATEEIEGYLGQLQKRRQETPHSNSLRAELGAANLPSSDEDCLATYKDWANRPFVSHFPSFIGDVDYTDYYRAELDALGDFDTWLQEQYVTQGGHYDSLTREGIFRLELDKGERQAEAVFRVKRKVTRGSSRVVTGMARAAYTQGGQRGSAFVPNLEAWAKGVQPYLISSDPSKLITEWDYER